MIAWSGSIRPSFTPPDDERAPQGCFAPAAAVRKLHPPCSALFSLESQREPTVSQIIRRIGVPPSERGSTGGGNCPDIFELADGNFAVIGTDATEALDAGLPSDASRADYERIVVVSRETLIRAKADIPDA